MRLTTMKDQIVSKVLAETIDKKIKATAEKAKEFGDSLVNELYAPYRERMTALPTTAFGTTSCIKLVWGSGRYENVYVDCCNHDTFKYPLQFETKPGSKVMMAYDDLKTEQSNLSKQRTDLAHDLRQVVNSVTTVKRLHEVWPEGKKWIDDAAGIYSRNLPMVTSESLNKKLCILLNDPESLPCKGA